MGEWGEPAAVVVQELLDCLREGVAGGESRATTGDIAGVLRREYRGVQAVGGRVEGQESA